MGFGALGLEDSTYYMEVMSLPENFKSETELERATPLGPRLLQGMWGV